MNRSTGVRVLWSVALFLPAILLAPSAVRGDICGNPGTNGAGSGGGVVNTYYPPASLGTIGPTDTTLNLGTATGAAATLKFGDMLLIIQMQDAEFNSQDDNHYGDGVAESPSSPNDPGSGSIRLNNTGLYEYVIVDDGATAFGTAVPSLASVPIHGEGVNGTLINSYTSAAFIPGSRGQERYQVVRVPQYTSLTLGATALTAAAWNGSTGGILAVDVRDSLILNNGTINVTGLGFRAGLGEKLSSGTPLANTTYRQDTSINAFGNKGEGIAGTPKNMANGVINPEGEGYPNGSRARGAPGNAGGGGNPQDVSTNTDSSGGGGGGNGGNGGNGGESGNGLFPIGGFGGSAFVQPTTTTPAWSAGRIIMGGGGGSGVKNNVAPPGAADGGPGGGIVLIRANDVNNAGGTTTGTINANGAPGHDGANNGGGGGGAGGSVIITILSGNLSGLTINAKGGDGGPAGTGVNQYGPGGGGGGGVVLASATGATVSTAPGANGLTNGVPLGASSGAVGTPPPGDPNNPLITPDDIPGNHSGAECNKLQANPDTYSTPQDTDLVVSAGSGVLANDTPIGGGLTAAFEAGNGPSNGTLFVALGSDGSFTYRPNTGFVGVDSFTYHAVKGGASSNSTTVTINVGVPTAVNDAYDINEDQTLTATAGGMIPGVLDNDNANGGSITAAKNTDPAFGSLSSFLSDGSFTYNPGVVPLGNSTQVTTFTYHAANGSVTSNIATVTITVHHVNHAPVAVNDPQYLMLPDTILDTTSPPIPGVLANDSDPDADSLTVFSHTGPVDSLSNPTGTLTLNNTTGSFTYTPPFGFTGPVTFTYIATDGTLNSASATVTILVKPDNAPVAVADAYATTQNTTLVVAVPGVLANDSDPDSDPLTAVLISGTTNGAVSLASDGSFTYTPGAGFVGTDSFTYQANDGILPSSTVTVTIVVNPPGTEKHPAGYCGLFALDAMLPLGILWLVRRRRLGRRARD